MSQTEVERKVLFEDGDELDAVRMRIRSEPGPLLPGTRIEVEIGARWKQGERKRVGGIWVPCEVIADTSKALVVKPLN